MTEGPSLARQAAIAILGLAAVLGWLAAGWLAVFTLLFTPDPGHELALRGLQLALVAGWIATLPLLIRDLLAGRLRFLAILAIGWLWVLGVGTVIGEVGYLNWGY